jgi:hypothetical protein
MSIETLNSAARAAGFAMAASDEPPEESKPEEKLESPGWHSGEPILLHAETAPAPDASAKVASSLTDWIKSAFGRRAPA